MSCSKNTTYCVSSQLVLFQGQCKQISQEKNVYVAHFPLATLSSSQLEFNVAASPMYTDLSQTRLYLKVRVVNTDGTVVDRDVEVTPVNMLLHALFRKIDVYVNGRLITQSSDTYPWKAAFETMLNFGKNAKDTQLESIFFYKDDTENTGMGKRFEKTRGSKPFELFGPLHVDFFFQQKYLLNNVPIRVVLTRTSPNFYLHSADGLAQYKIELLQANLFVRRIQVSTAVELAHARALEKSNAIYPMNKSEIELIPIPTGSRILTKDGLFAGRIPKKLIFVMLSSNSLNGGYDDSPFRFLGQNVHRVDITLNGEPIGDTPISCDFSNDLFLRAYHNLYAALNKSYTNTDIDLSMKDFKTMYTMFCFDLTSDSCGNAVEHFEIERKGNLRIVVGLKDVDRTLYALFYGEFESALEITQAREVVLP